jgi:CDGSH-type Zn-finger protein
MDLPVIAQKSPYKVTLQPGKYAWCTCGLSQKQPFCDSAHKGTEFKSLKFEVEEETTFYLCGCKQTGTAPFCNGTHNSL